MVKTIDPRSGLDASELLAESGELFGSSLDVERTLSQLAELGVIFLMFGVGLHFSLNDLWKVRSVAIPGALGRMIIVILLGFVFSQLNGWTVTSGIVSGRRFAWTCGRPVANLVGYDADNAAAGP